MSLHAFKEPIAMVSRSRPGSSPPRMRLPQTSRRTLYTSSRVLAALDAQLGSKREKEDDSIEILGSFPALSKSEGTSSKVRKSAKPLHPFFLNGADGEFRPMGSRSKTTVCPQDTTTGIEETSVPTIKSTQKQINDSSKDAFATSSNSLPAYSYKDYSPTPTTVYTQHEEEANDLVETLKGPLGFDMEWRVIFRRGAGERKTALVQLSDERMILLMQISSMTKFPQKVKQILESPEVIKLGANIRNDAAKLFRDFGICAHNLVELGALAKHIDPSFVAVHKQPIVSLANMVAYYAGKTLKKGTERLGNWEAQLEENMIHYAANDAHCAVIVYEKLRSIVDEHGITPSPAAYTIDVTGLPTPAPSTTNISTRNAFDAPTNDASSEAALPSERPRPQHLRAYHMWHRDSRPLSTMCAELTSRGHPLKESTVISYVVEALRSDQRLPFDIQRLKELVRMEASSWRRHRGWIAGAEAKGRGA